MELNIQESLLAMIGLLLLFSSISQWVTLLRKRSLPIAAPPPMIDPDDSTDESDDGGTDGGVEAETSPAPPISGRVNLPAFVVAVLWVGLSLLMHVQNAIAEPEKDPATLHDVQVSCILNFALWAFMGWLLTDQGRRSIGEWGGRFPPTHFDWELGTKTFLLILVPVFVLLYATAPFRTEETMHEFLQLLRADPTPVTMIWLIVAAVFMAPLAEELMFRVILQGWLLDRVAPHAAVATVAVIFAAVHGWPDMIPLLPLSLILGYVYYYFRSYTAAVIAHALFNGLNLFLSVTSA